MTEGASVFKLRHYASPNSWISKYNGLIVLAGLHEKGVQIMQVIWSPAKPQAFRVNKE
jgi:hypothetical protein